MFYSPIETYRVPKVRSISRFVYSTKEMRSILDTIRTDRPLSIRTKAILELAYSSALRSCEIRHLCIEQIDTASGMLFIERSKNRKDRKVPVGEIALKWIGTYIRSIRPRFLNGQAHSVVFISHRGGNPLSASGLWRGIMETFTASGTEPIRPHSIRASCATALLENGMHVSYIAEILRHAELSTTQVYLRMKERALSEEIRRRHPRSHMELQEEEYVYEL